ncbi:hypothetical protein NKF26_18240 [Haladaptatus sp. AB618]|uniref:hypothetical protein n=1 Tax=Haladaptatus sp. AB618 TaxID=2934173 RepID=UPI00209C1C29|nr:hypothetical protein [Haladaptatus sp. AB618]MCO8255751.1 hypothetical protein [Haladaptatus sp. AB618]
MQTVEPTTTSAVFVHVSPNDVIGYHRPADADGERGCWTDDTLETPTVLLSRAQQHAADVVAEHFPDLPVETIEWESSHRAQRTAGVTKYDPTTEAITITLTETASE